MSSVKIQSNASGTGDLIIAAPNTNSTRTINLPDADGDFVTTGDSGTVSASMLASTLDLSGKTVTLPSGTGGKVLQVVGSHYTTGAYTNSASYSDTGLSASITPSSTSSKILIIATPQVQITRDGGNAVRGRLAIYRGDSTNLTFKDIRGYDYGGSGIIIGSAAGLSYLDSPSTTSAITYKLKQYLTEGNYIETNVSASGSDMVLMEIAA